MIPNMYKIAGELTPAVLGMAGQPGAGYRPVMPMPSPRTRPGGLADRLWRLPRSLAHPVVLTFVTAAYFSYVTGDTVRAGYLMTAGLALTWDHARRRVPAETPAEGMTGPGAAGGMAAFSRESADRRRAAMRRIAVPALLAGVAYSVVVGSLQRYSWPATVAVNVPAVAGVLLAWRVSAGSAGEPARLSRGGVALWALVWVGGAVWELTALYLQPTLATDSYAHPTLSYLADPALASVPGRSAVLFGWLALGWYLARR